MADDIKTAVLIGGGRMGQLIADALAADGTFKLLGTYDIDNCSELDGAAPAADVAIDFSNRASLSHTLAYVRRTHAALVSGTTGFDEGELASIRSLGEVAPVIWSANYSLGVAVVRRLAARAARALADFDIEIVETHHNQKVDAPSGTANLLREAVDPRGSCTVTYGREGFVGTRPAREIGMHSLRGGTVAGTHEIHFFGQDEEVVLTHRATSRQIFVSGAVAAAKRLVGRPAGFYTFDDLMFA